MQKTYPCITCYTRIEDQEIDAKINAKINVPTAEDMERIATEDTTTMSTSTAMFTAEDMEAMYPHIDFGLTKLGDRVVGVIQQVEWQDDQSTSDHDDDQQPPVPTTNHHDAHGCQNCYAYGFPCMNCEDESSPTTTVVMSYAEYRTIDSPPTYNEFVAESRAVQQKLVAAMEKLI